MPGNIPHGDGDLPVCARMAGNIIIIIATGFIAIDAFARDLQSVHFYDIPWQETLLDLWARWTAWLDVHLGPEDRAIVSDQPQGIP